MPENTRPRPICAHCDGFPQVVITTGQTTPTGRRQTITADCPACHGTGRTLPGRSHTRVGV
ncbi:hypothetical protein [Streptomyces atroolivaceus]|uniref:hypothetical protein n=1 Tax=Streptomyces atroolivaceus TaxID=66869 RepID=UPI0020245688|nr:hypothetical protein [Streptomyces atroolivaceus]